jgi:group I intron endonuclease
MKDKTMIIYKATNKVNKKIYIGMTTKTLKERIAVHKRAYKWTEYAFHRALRKYGFDEFSFKIIGSAKNVDDLAAKECKFIKKYDSMNPKIGYNMIAQDDHMKIFNKETRAKISRSQIARCKNMTKENKELQYKKSAISRQGVKRNKTNKYIGVCKSIKANSYSVDIGFSHNGKKQRYRKVFPEKIDAARAYDRIVLYLYGETAKLNFPDSKKKYLKEDLKNYADWFLHCPHKLGRRSVRGYSFGTLLQRAKANACKILQKKLNKKIITSDIISSLLRIKFHYDGYPYKSTL